MMRLLATNSPQICAVFTIAATKHEKKLAFRSLVELDWIELEGREGGEGRSAADLLQLISEASQARQLCRQSGDCLVCIGRECITATVCSCSKTLDVQTFFMRSRLDWQTGRQCNALELTALSEACLRPAHPSLATARRYIKIFQQFEQI